MGCWLLTLACAHLHLVHSRAQWLWQSDTYTVVHAHTHIQYDTHPGCDTCTHTIHSLHTHGYSSNIIHRQTSRHATTITINFIQATSTNSGTANLLASTTQSLVQEATMIFTASCQPIIRWCTVQNSSSSKHPPCSCCTKRGQYLKDSCHLWRVPDMGAHMKRGGSSPDSHIA